MCKFFRIIIISCEHNPLWRMKFTCRLSYVIFLSSVYSILVKNTITDRLITKILHKITFDCKLLNHNSVIFYRCIMLKKFDVEKCL